MSNAVIQPGAGGFSTVSGLVLGGARGDGDGDGLGDGEALGDVVGCTVGAFGAGEVVGEAWATIIWVAVWLLSNDSAAVAGSVVM